MELVLQWLVIAHRITAILLNVVSRTLEGHPLLRSKLVSHHPFNHSHCDQQHLASFEFSKMPHSFLGSVHLGRSLHVLFLMSEMLFPSLSIP